MLSVIIICISVRHYRTSKGVRSNPSNPPPPTRLSVMCSNRTVPSLFSLMSLLRRVEKKSLEAAISFLLTLISLPCLRIKVKSLASFLGCMFARTFETLTDWKGFLAAVHSRKNIWKVRTAEREEFVKPQSWLTALWRRTHHCIIYFEINSISLHVDLRKDGTQKKKQWPDFSLSNSTGRYNRMAPANFSSWLSASMMQEHYWNLLAYSYSMRK